MAPPLLDRVFSSRLLQQTLALTYKNALVAWRSRRATILRLLAPFVFLLLALIIQLALDANNKREGRVQENAVSAPRLIPSIPDCNQDLFIGSRRCSTFVYSPNASSVVQEIIAGVKAANSPPIKDDKVIGFASRQDAEDYMLANPESTLGAVHFDVDDSTAVPKINYLIQSNSTVKAFKGNNQSPITFFAIPIQAAVSRAASKHLYGLSGKDPETFDWQPQLALFPHPQLRSIGMVGYVLGPFIFASCMFGLVTQLGAIVGEKETGLVTSLRHMGLLQSSYWLSWVLFDVLMGLATSLSIVMWGNILQFRFFLRNDAGILVLLFWLFLMALNSFSYFLSVFLSKQQSAVYMGFVVFLVGWIMQTIAIFGLPYDPQYFFTRTGRAFFRIFSCLPWCPLIKGTLDLAAATGSDKDPGIRWRQRSTYCQHIPDTTKQPAYDSTKTFIDYDCVYPLNDIYINLVIQAVVWLAIALYLDNVWPSGSGKTRPPWYFLMPSYWVNHTAGTVRHLRKTDSITSSADRRSSDNQRGLGTQPESAPQGKVRLAAGLQGPSGRSSTPETTDANVAVVEPGRRKPANGEEDEDVTAEANRMKALLKYRISGLSKASRGLQPSAKRIRDLQNAVAAADNSTVPTAELAVEVYGLSKVFKGPLGCGPNKGSMADFWAIKGSWFGIQEGQLFCLLGPNGAGKTTTINCLTGILAATGGDMLVCGESVCTEGGLDRIRPQIGVCPLFDVLWGELTGLEHLVISGHVKGIPFSQVRQHASDLLNKVQLLSAANMRSGAYSGGMKRRLSVALALLGNPTVLYLDEPTTGMDPISRRYVWDVIQAAKPGRAIVLTTHSMEEADILGDRIAIMARGAIKAIGNSIRLKQKFGAGYQLIVTLKPDAKAPQQALQVPPTAQPHRQPGEPLSSAQLHLHEADNSHVPLASRATRQAVMELVGRHLSGLRPEEEGKYTIRYAVPRNQQQQLIELLRVIEKGSAGETSESAELSGIADVQLSLTSLEEVFLTIAKQAELEAASVTGATVSVHLPDSGKEVQVPVGQDWYEERQATQLGNVQVRYHIKWVQDDSGALTVLEVSPAKPRQHDGAVGSSTGSPRAGAASSPGLPGTSFRSVLAPVAP